MSLAALTGSAGQVDTAIAVQADGSRSAEAWLSLAYRRPWLSSAAPARILAVSADETDRGELLAAIILPEPGAQPLSLAQPAANGGALDLPTAYNWCELGGCTPVKDQGDCNSGWAFATVAPLEAAIKLKDAVTADLSEQYLLSCNVEGWNCVDGGWWAHDYHWVTYYPPETGPGAVDELSFPYVASDVPCGGPYPHPYVITYWDTVGPGNTVPPAAELKQALVDRGPLAVAVCAGSGWQGYYDGVFSTDEKDQCGGGVNHEVTLVGWDDVDEAWTIKNSWGADWGESGYMRIKYGISNIGYGASYIEYTPSSPLDESVYLPLVARTWLPVATEPALITVR